MGQDTAALVFIEELRLLQQIEDFIDIEGAENAIF